MSAPKSTPLPIPKKLKRAHFSPKGISNVSSAAPSLAGPGSQEDKTSLRRRGGKFPDKDDLGLAGPPRDDRSALQQEVEEWRESRRVEDDSGIHMEMGHMRMERWGWQRGLRSGEAGKERRFFC